MGNWPDPVSGNKEIVVVGPKTDIGGLAAEFQALNYSGGSADLLMGYSYYFPFQVHNYWTPTAIIMEQDRNAFWNAPQNISFIIQLAIYAEIGDTTAKKIVTTTPWETRTQGTVMYREHALQSVLRLPPGGYYVGYQNASALSSSNTPVIGYGASNGFNRVFGVRQSSFSFQNLVVDLSASNMGVPYGLVIKTQ